MAARDYLSPFLLVFLKNFISYLRCANPVSAHIHKFLVHPKTEQLLP